MDVGTFASSRRVALGIALVWVLWLLGNSLIGYSSLVIGKCPSDSRRTGRAAKALCVGVNIDSKRWLQTSRRVPIGAPVPPPGQ